MLKFKNHLGNTIFLAEQEIQMISFNEDESEANITTHLLTFKTKDVEVVKSFLSKKSELAQQVSYLTSAIRDLYNLLRARLR